MNHPNFKRVVFVLLFFAILVAGDRCISFGLRRIIGCSKFRFVQIYEGHVHAGILLMGDSRGVHSLYAPGIERATGIPTFNASFNATPVRLSEVIFLDYLDHCPPPKMIVLELNSMRASDRVLEDLKMFTPDSPRMAKILAEEYPITATTGKFLNLIYFNSEMFLRSLYYFGKSDQSWIMKSKMSPSMLNEALHRPMERFTISSENLAALRRIVSVAKAKGIEIRLILSPYFPPAARKIPNLDEFVSNILECVGPDVPIYDYSTAIESGDCFADRLHLNSEGSDQFLKLLLHDRVFEMTRESNSDKSSNKHMKFLHKSLGLVAAKEPPQKRSTNGPNFQ